MKGSIILPSSAIFFVFFIVLTINNLLLCDGSFNVSCIQSEREALLKIKQDLHDPSKILTSWTGESCCKWSGIICHKITGHVHKLILRGPKRGDTLITIGTTSFANYEAYRKLLLGGKINPSLLELKHLHHLDLSNTDFGGIRIPEFFGSLRRLRYLNLSQARFGGVIPRQLGNLTDLRFLDLRGLITDDYNSISYDGYAKNLQWLSHLSRLEYLDMSGIDLGQAFDWLEVTSSLPSLVVLRLSYCRLIFNDIPLIYHVNFSSLATLDLSGNSFYGDIPKWVFNLRSLASLDLSRNIFDGAIPEGIQNATSLMHLDLSWNNFNSSIPSWLYKMSRLEFLSLGGNGLRGTISSDIKNLTSIIRLDLSWNELEGKFPTSISKLCKLKEIYFSSINWNQKIFQVLETLLGCVSDGLETLDLSSGKLYGPLTNHPIGQFKNLAHLSLHGNSISGHIPISLSKLSSLRFLTLSYNRFNGSLPESFGQLSELVVLDIFNNFLEGIVSGAHFANMSKLRYLSASRNPLTLKVGLDWIPPFRLYSLHMDFWHLGPGFPMWLRSQENLYELSISNTRLAGVIPSWFWDSFEFEYLDLSYNALQGRIQNMSINKEIYLNHNYFEGQLPSISCNVVGLDFSNNSFSGSISHFLCNRLSEQMNLKILHLESNQLSGTIANCWTKWQNLVIMDLSNNKFNGSIPPSLGALSFLQSLHLRKNHLSGELPLSLHNCTMLFTLDLGENNFTGTIPSWLGTKMLKMRILSLRSNKFSGHIPDELCALNSLQVLDLSHNNLLGHIPKCINNFSVMIPKNDHAFEGYSFTTNDSTAPTSFTESALLVVKGQEAEYEKILHLVNSIDLSSNFLTGHIPMEITDLSSLVSLNLSKNLLTGEIPWEIGKMRALESADFSMNQLSGEIPESMSSMSFLSHLNLSCNNLTGRIPSGTQLQSFDASSFIGNNLCGPPSTQNCSTDGVTPAVENNENQEGDIDMSWFYLGMGVGFAVGFWGVCAALFFNRKWRHNYFQLLDRMKETIYVTSSLKLRWFHEKFRNYSHNQ